MYMGLKLLKWLEMDFKHKFKKLVQFYPPGAKPSFYEAFNLHLFGPEFGKNPYFFEIFPKKRNTFNLIFTCLYNFLYI